MQNMDTEKARFMAAYDFLRQQSVCDTNRIAAIGYCFGGGVVLQAARFGIPLTGVVSFHGSLATQMPARPGQVRAKILVCTGDSDKFNSAETVQNFRREMDSAGADYRVIVYPGAQHSFTNPDADSLGRINNIPIGYNAAADKQSWADMQDFFKRIFPEKSSTM
jgi:dienelactone hydrolase